ncbi:hypothetical protein PISMIDRAFT_405552 [Pisolithus microcarpus 441]|uniref:Unplaced genomic scaffold scaffold_317, whole genome shotgun sequence n=1 Tax=Pisolithus microcarpus 441 TaxID=765257 RepID=A0A0C9YSR3_9AGAM|nr:hypothetical protein PISMIDRAFT_405552 [Pisolithus microcarpus 441]
MMTKPVSFLHFGEIRPYVHQNATLILTWVTQAPLPAQPNMYIYTSCKGHSTAFSQRALATMVYFVRAVQKTHVLK